MSINVTPAANEAEVSAAVAVLWPQVAAGQAGFGLDGLRSPEALTQAWTTCVRRPTDALLLARDGDELVGACGLYVYEGGEAQTANGPVAVRDHDAVYDALLVAMTEMAPGARVVVGVSHRHERARAWLARHGAEELEHLYPYSGATRGAGLPTGVHRVAAEEQERFAELYDSFASPEMMWTSSRVREHWGEWIVLVDDGWSGLLAARNYGNSDMSEVFLADGPERVLRDVGRGWLAEAAAAGKVRAVWFAESPAERAAAEACGLTCSDEYLAFVLTLSR